MDVDAAALCGAEIVLHAYIYAIEALAGNDCRFTTGALASGSVRGDEGLVAAASAHQDRPPPCRDGTAGASR